MITIDESDKRNGSKKKSVAHCGNNVPGFFLVIEILVVLSFLSELLTGVSLAGQLFRLGWTWLNDVRSAISNIIHYEAICKTAEMLGLISILVVQIYKHIDEQELGVVGRELLKNEQTDYIVHVIRYAVAIIGCIWSAYNSQLELTLLWIAIICCELYIHAKTYIHIILNQTTRRNLAIQYYNNIFESSMNELDEKIDQLCTEQNRLIAQLNNEHLLDEDLYILLAKGFSLISQTNKLTMQSYIIMWTDLFKEKNEESCYLVLSHLLIEIDRQVNDDETMLKILGSYYCWICNNAMQKDHIKDADEYNIKHIQNVYNIIQTGKVKAIIDYLLLVVAGFMCNFITGREDPSDRFFYLLGLLREYDREIKEERYKKAKESTIYKDIFTQVYGDDISKKYGGLSLELAYVNSITDNEE